MEQAKLDRISELYRKSKSTVGLTTEEKAEQTTLRNEYRAGFKRNLTAQLESCVIVDEKGNKTPVRERKGS